LNFESRYHLYSIWKKSDLFHILILFCNGNDSGMTYAFSERISHPAPKLPSASLFLGASQPWELCVSRSLPGRPLCQNETMRTPLLQRLCSLNFKQDYRHLQDVCQEV